MCCCRRFCCVCLPPPNQGTGSPCTLHWCNYPLWTARQLNSGRSNRDLPGRMLDTLSVTHPNILRPRVYNTPAVNQAMIMPLKKGDITIST